jgi:diguanylate cyclase (GGDEF)-like protein
MALNEQVAALQAQIEQLRRERDYYQRHADELAGEGVKRDYTISMLRHALKQKRQGFALLSELQGGIGSQQTLEEIFDSSVHGINATLGMDRALVLVPDTEQQVFRPAAWMGFDANDELLHFSNLHIDTAWLNSGEALLVNRATTPTAWVQQLQSTLGLPYLVMTPIRGAVDCIGLLVAGRTREQKPFAPPLDEGDVDTLQSIAALIAAFVHNREMMLLKADNAMLRHQAMVDKLTGIPNRRHFEEVMQQEWARALRRGAALSLFLLDVDHFKACNDQFGHDVGDAILRQVAQHLTRGLRPGDIGARYGGEEFVVLLPDTGEEGAVAVAERIRHRIQLSPMQHYVDDACSHLTVSIGVATVIPDEASVPSQLITAADQALYRAKREGRNRVTFAV